jgi:hypothetical protein
LLNRWVRVEMVSRLLHTIQSGDELRQFSD